MASIEELQRLRSEAATELVGLFGRTPDGDVDTGAEWTDAQNVRYNDLRAQIDRIDGDIDRLEVAGAEAKRMAAAESDRTERVKRLAEESGRSADEEHADAEADRRVFSTFLRFGREGIRSAPDAQRLSNVLQTDTDAAGGYTVPVDLRSQIIRNLTDYGGVRAVATVINVSSGVKVQWPTLSETTQEGEIVAEGSAATELDPAFGQKELEFDMYSSKVVKVSRQLLQDTSIAIEPLITGLLSTRLARYQAKVFTVGSSTASHHVRGLQEDGSVGYTLPNGGSNTTAVTFDALVKLYHSLDPIFRGERSTFQPPETTGLPGGGASWMMPDAVLLALKEVKDGDSRPLWLPGVVPGAPDTIYGRPYVINNQLPTPAADKHSVLFGAFSNYTILDAINMELHRFGAESAYATRNQVGFLVVMRSAARLTDYNGETVKKLQQSAS